MTPPATGPQVSAAYGPVQDDDMLIPAVPPQYLTGQTIRRQVDDWTDAPRGTIIVNPFDRAPGVFLTPPL
ncbi:hypothetical protein SAMN05878503_10369 [Cereibacter ovatus]|uniref:Uncharacterized protein n=1 Tax=Cereibacter ovatus TaxID=439529 RepID=A0A285CQ33_9RHOB|nr:hypothetical protein [Cereibacter ovatus]SNX69083.1 hypothetical protein SAMN05878503_10369 [Cereibacter ovatus]